MRLIPDAKSSSTGRKSRPDAWFGGGSPGKPCAVPPSAPIQPVAGENFMADWEMPQELQSQRCEQHILMVYSGCQAIKAL